MTNSQNIQTIPNLPINLISKIASNFKPQFRDDLIQEMSLLFVVSPPERQTPQYVNAVYKLRCRDFIKDYRHDPNKVKSLDKPVKDDEEGLSHVHYLESDENVEQDIIYDDLIANLDLTPEEKLIQKLYYFEGYTVKEIAKDFAQQTFIRNAATIRNILKKGQ